jgi:SAM-dependent methyltransferase
MVRPVARLPARGARTSMRLRALGVRDRIAGGGDRLLPPRRLQLSVGEGEFAATGDELLSRLVSLCGLRPEDRVLDVGCGAGRLARPLAGFLSLDGAYAGLDADPAAIAWCRRRYAHFPQFAFVPADVPAAGLDAGGTGAAAFAFPFADGSFDVAVLVSGLDHLSDQEALHRLGQVRRVLAPGGRVLASGRWGPEREEWLFEALRAAGLDLVALHPGRWTGREDGLDLDDVVVARA